MRSFINYKIVVSDLGVTQLRLSRSAELRRSCRMPGRSIPRIPSRRRTSRYRILQLQPARRDGCAQWAMNASLLTSTSCIFQCMLNNVCGIPRKARELSPRPRKFTSGYRDISSLFPVVASVPHIGTASALGASK